MELYLLLVVFVILAGLVFTLDTTPPTAAESVEESTSTTTTTTTLQKKKRKKKKKITGTDTGTAPFADLPHVYNAEQTVWCRDPKPPLPAPRNGVAVTFVTEPGRCGPEGNRNDGLATECVDLTATGPDPRSEMCFFYTCRDASGRPTPC